MPVESSPALPRVPWNRPFHVMAKPIGARCNLDCEYCFYLEKEPAFYPGAGAPRMSETTLATFVRDYLAAQPGEEVTFSWQGGEPTLMGVEFFERTVALQRQYAAGRKVNNTLQTNGTLLDERWGEFLAREHFLVGLSVDGPRELHNAYRIDRGGRPTWDNVMRGLKILKKHRVDFNTLTVVHRRNVRRGLEIYEFLRSEGVRYLQFIPLVERKPLPSDLARGLVSAAPPGLDCTLVPPSQVKNAVRDFVAAPELFGAFLAAIFDRWVKRDVGETFVQTFDIALSAWMGLGAPLCVFQERCGKALAIEHNGNLYACDHYVYPEHMLGNIHTTPIADLGHGEGTNWLANEKANLPKACRECPVRFICNGDCPKHRFVAAGEGEPGISYLCPAYKPFFTHIDPAMKRMAALVHAGHPASHIMPSEGR